MMVPMKLGGTTLKTAGLIVLAVLALGVAAFAMNRQPALPPVSDQVKNYTPPTETAAPVVPVVAIGDSYSAGAGATDKANGFIYQLGRSQSWNLTNLARGGTGYVASITSNAKVACGLEYCPRYAEMVKDAAAANPGLVIVSGGRNDSTRAAADEADAVAGFYKGLRAALPDTKIVALSPLWDAGTPPASLSGIASEVKAAVESVGGAYLDIGQPLQGRPELMSADKVHPNDAGHAAIAKAVRAKLQAAGI